jgi:chromosome segregation protein
MKMVRIEKIKFRDFKSFRNNIIPFVDGFTTIVGPNGSGKCLRGDSEVLLASGRKKRIDELVVNALARGRVTMLDDGALTIDNPDNIEVLSLDLGTLKIAKRRVSAFVKRDAPKTLLKIKTKSGKEITATAYHPLFTLKNGVVVPVKAEQLKPGTPVAVPSFSLEDEASPASHDRLQKQILVIGTVAWDAIESIEHVEHDEEFVYDLCVEKDHNFIAENMVVHNSNVIDGLLFVLGEGSMKTLRAQTLSHLVANNSRDGTAEVTLEIRNDAGDKVAIARSIDKQGQSVYRMNEKRSTRQEITETLSHLRIPPDCHNVILQGEVMQLTRMTPKQRREILDDVSGIAEYNDKKEKAMRELDAVQKKLDEANIILNERKGWIGDIKRERDEALRYQRFKERADALRHCIVSRELKEIEAKWNDLSATVAKAKEEVDELNDQLRLATDKLAAVQEQRDSINAEIMSKAEHQQVIREIEQIRSKIQLIDEKTNNRREAATQAEIVIKNAEAAMKNLAAEVSEKRESLKRLLAEEKGLAERVGEKEKELEAFMADLRQKNLLAGDIMARLETLNAAMASRKEEFYKLTGLANQLRERVSALRLTMSTMVAETDFAGGRITELEQQYESANKAFAEHKRDAKGFELELEGLLKNEKQTNEEITKAEQALENAKEQYHSLQSKVLAIRHMTGSHASDAVMRAKDEIGGVVGRVEDLVQFDDKHATAIQAAAGPRMHYIITENAETATRAVKWLKAKKLGRTTFIPLDSIRPPETGDAALKAAKAKGALGLLLDFVKHDKKHAKALQFVFGDTVLVEDIDAAARIGFGSCRLVTLEGDIAEASGAVTGGYRETALTLQEIRNVDELREKQEQLERRKQRLLKELDQLRGQMNAVRGKKAEVELKAREEEITVRSLKERVDEYSATRQKHDERKGQAEREVEDLRKQLGGCEEKLKTFQPELKKLEAEKDSLRERSESPEVREVSAHLDELQKKVQSVRDSKAEVTIQVNSLKQEIDKLLSAREAELRNAVSEAKNAIAKAEGEIKHLDKEKSILQKQLAGKIEEEKKISSEISALVERREALEGEMNKLAEERGQLQRRFEVKQNYFNEQNLEKARVETRYLDLKKEFDEARAVEEFELTVEQMKEEVVELTGKMAKLEPINLKAVEQYEKALQDLEVHREKAKKLDEEKLAVIEMMNNIETRRKEVFMEAFNAIRENFARIYKEFFPGTDAMADMKLENPESPFEGGLELEAKPAGKQLKYIDAMSGGEKSLTALAFLFAIQEHRPSPFYVLDEADAALDKANSQRLAEMIRGRSDRCQFIVVTHNNPVIHSSDQIVGVSMDKAKGSSIVEVDLKSLGERPEMAAAA